MGVGSLEPLLVGAALADGGRPFTQVAERSPGRRPSQGAEGSHGAAALAVHHLAHPVVEPEAGGARRLHQHHQRQLFPLRPQLLGHLEGHDATQAESAQAVRPLGLEAAELRDQVGGQLLDPAQRGLPPVHARRLERVQRLVEAEVLGEGQVAEDVPVVAGDAEEGRARPSGWMGTTAERRSAQPRAARRKARTSGFR